ncbi:MAG: hypothetical protein ACLUUF_01050 [Bifidobacterium pullorum]|uniref:hypothetical protein n=1 Tax=Bifidobacterium sp. TaxID=41200 RepID=UPI00257DC66E|nr:hypothetical protein [Bifidobacterium sp.]MBS5402092.1 hypothetical protein [Bifidobacterium sp.]
MEIGVWIVIGLVLVTLATVAFVVWRAVSETRGDRLVVENVLKIRETGRVRIRYGVQGLRPFTWGRDTSMVVRVPVEYAGVDLSPASLVETGIRMQQLLSYDGVECRTPRPRWREWRLVR